MFSVQGLGFRVQGSGFRVQGSGFREVVDVGVPRTRVGLVWIQDRLEPFTGVLHLQENAAP